MAITVARTRSATDNYLRHPSVLHRRVNFNSPGVTLASTLSGAFCVGVLPPGACPIETVVRVTTAFSAGHLTLSTTGSSSSVVAAADLAEGSTGVTVVNRVANLAYSTGDIAIYANLSSTAATTGSADVWIRYYEMEHSASAL